MKNREETIPVRIMLLRKLQEHFEYRVGLEASLMILRVTKFNSNEELAAYSLIDLFDDYRTLPVSIAISEIAEFVIADIEKKLAA